MKKWNISKYSDSTDLRSVQSIADDPTKPSKALNQNVPLNPFFQKVETVVFGGQPTFVSVPVHPLKTSCSIFGHLAFGSNMPNFKMLGRTSSTRKSKAINKRTFEDSDLIRLDRTTSTPNVLVAVGLCKIPKTYSRKKNNYQCHGSVRYNTRNVFLFMCRFWSNWTLWKPYVNKQTSLISLFFKRFHTSELYKLNCINWNFFPNDKIYLWVSANKFYLSLSKIFSKYTLSLFIIFIFLFSLFVFNWALT